MVQPRPEYTRPSLRRSRWINLNGEWEFGTGEKASFDRQIMVPFCPESGLSGVAELPGDVVWYRRRFEAPAGDRLVLHFGAVDYRATVWVNDVEVASHEGGHTPFSADLTSVIRPRNNTLVVRAEDPLSDKTIPRGKQYWKENPEGIFYTPTTGIWQTVWLEALPERHIQGLRLQPNLAAGAVDFELTGQGRAELVARLDREVVGRWSGLAGRGRIVLEQAVPWHPDSPRLYEVEARLFDQDGKVTDRVDSYFGLRTIETKAGRCWLNGEPYVQRLVLDQGYFPGGLLTATSDDVLRRDIELAQALGFNGARKHQKVEDPRWLEWAEVVRRDRDHPSVVAWVVANESFGLGDVDPSVRSNFLGRLYRVTHDLDGTRPVVSNDGWEPALTDMCTIHDYSPPAVLARRYRSVDSALEHPADHPPVYAPGYGYRGEPLMVTEFGGLRIAGSAGWGWLEVEDLNAFLHVYRDLIDALMDTGPVQGFCYTQLTDVEQEQNGLLTFDRRPKVDPDLIRPITQTPKRG